jgi:hypothetical protein
VWGVLTNDGLERDAVIGKVYFSDPAPRPVNVEVSVRFGVTIGGLEPVYGVEYALEGIHRYIADHVLPALEPFV